MKQIKVLLVANVAKEHVRKFHIPTIKYLRERGWRVDVACKLDAPLNEANNAYNMAWERNPFTFKTFKGIRQLKSIIRENQYDIVYCHTPVGGLTARIAARDFRKLGVKVVYCAHGLHFYKGSPLLNWCLYYPVEKYLARLTDMFITINHEDYELVVRHFNHKMQVKRIDGIGVNFNRLDVENRMSVRDDYRTSLDLPKNSIVLIYVAEIIKNKNQQMLIRALANLRKRGCNAYLLLVGPDHSNGEEQKLAKDLELNEYVKFLGWRNDIGQLMTASDICVASSVREGFGINLIEAQYCHLPIVAVNNRGHRSVIKNGENGFLVPLDDYDTMADKIIEIISDKRLYKRLSSVDISRYTSENVSKTIYDFLTKLLEINV